MCNFYHFLKNSSLPAHKIIAGVVFIICCNNILYAQKSVLPQQEISGTVYSKADGLPIAGVTVRVKGSDRGTFTDENGKFRIAVGPNDTLVITAIGFMSLECPCEEKKLLKLMLAEDRQQLGKVMIIGYGSEKKRNITGSIASVSAAEIAHTSAISFDNAIIGKAAGVNVLPSSGIPGSATAITIRGISTLNPDGNQPLIVVDGIPVYGSGKDLNTNTFNPSSTQAIGFGGTYVSDNLSPRSEFENNPLAYLNPSDISSIEILKDAYATSIYGSRGAAGVILITTKKGRDGAPAFNIRYITGAAQPVGSYDLLNGEEYSKIYTEYYEELGQDKDFNSPYNTDWVDKVSRTAITQNLNVSMSAGGDKTRYYLSGSYTDQPSYIINNGYKRYTGRINLTYEASKAFTIGTNMSISYADNTALNAASIYRSAILKAPNLPVFNEDGQYAYGKGSNPFGDIDANPLADAMLNTNSLQTTQTLGNVYVEYQPLNWLTLRSEFGTEFNNGNTFTRRVKRPSGFGDDAVEGTSENRKIVINNTASFLKTMGNIHYINAVIGQSFEKSTESSRLIGGQGFFSDQINSINAAERTYISESLTQQWALVSYFSRINYEYKNKYLAGVTYRIDGSSRFSKNRRYVGFPSFSAGWRLSEEAFLDKYSWIDDLKLRASIGFSGNNNIFSYYGNQGQYHINDNGLGYAGTPILEMQQPDNPNLKWERTRSIDIGLDASLWHGGLSVTADYYERRIKDMILSSAIPLYQGWSIQPQNIGNMVNKGIELTVNAEPVRKSEFNWSVRFNISRNRNKILRLNFVGEEVGLANDAYKYLKAGQPVAQFYLYEWVGVDQGTGNPLWRYPKGNVSDVPPASLFAQVEDVNDFRKVYGSSLPDFFGGLGNTFSYKNWELDAFFSFSVGGKMINGSKATLLTYSTDDAHNLSTRILDYWLIPGQETGMPRLANQSITASPGSAGGIRDFTTSRTNSRFIEDASYIRLRSINLAYNIDPHVLQRLTGKVMRSLQLFIRGTNLFTWSRYSGVDPEVNAFGSSALQSGYDELTMPQNKIIQIGINVGL